MISRTLQRTALALALIVMPLLAGGVAPDSTAIDSVRLDTLAQKVDSLVAQQDQMKDRLLAIKRLLVKRLEAAEADTSIEYCRTRIDTLHAQRDNANGSGR